MSCAHCGSLRNVRYRLLWININGAHIQRPLCEDPECLAFSIENENDSDWDNSD